jgi:hypothetical protein
MINMFYFQKPEIYIKYRNRRARDRMVVGFTTTYAISIYHN